MASGGPVRGKRSRVTLRDVAESAGTSRSTASRALSGTGYVAEHIKERVQAAADRLGYVPDVSARTLKGRSSGVIGLLVSDLRNQFYAELAAGVEHTLSSEGYQVVLVDDHGSAERAVDAARAFLAMRADGVLIAPVGRGATELLVEHGMPVTEVDRRSGVRGCDVVTIDSRAGARAAVDHLLALGHRAIGVVVDETFWDTGRDRLRGYRAALRAAGVTAGRRHVLDLGHTARPAPEEVSRFLDAEPTLTAVFAANNVVAELVWLELKRRGVSVPDQYSLVSFDDLPWMRMVDPGVTAVRQPVFAMGERAAGLLLERVRRGGGGRSGSVVLEPELAVRDSTSAPRG
ncbi:LacI family DNA-binding transcriptional regulator [Streptomyces sp. DSM 41524]|uniref:LacI family DNA-binding transcriptional regulator n=1 Tax=Streptomyces asiaticus subsp. ignotus TaxID=3098222 RepID=A0ABU7PX82_9ACTN|nr:LacI family DNA-binding transcriptional regulator [Streptomyces sp. DSM 41524]